jgi:hypothetical protein
MLLQLLEGVYIQSVAVVCVLSLLHFPFPASAQRRSARCLARRRLRLGLQALKAWILRAGVSDVGATAVRLG